MRHWFKDRFKGMSGWRLPRTSISTRLYVGFGLLLLMLGVVGGLGQYQAALLSERTRVLVEEDGRRATLAGDMQIAVQDLVMVLGYLSRQSDPEEIKDLKENFKKSVERYQSVRKSFYDMPIEGNEQWTTLQKSLTDIEQDALYLFNKMADLAGTTDAETLSKYYAMTVSRPQEMWLETLTQQRKLVVELTQAAAEKSQAAARGAQFFAIGVVAVALAVGLMWALAISRSIGTPLKQAVNLAEAVSKGDLCVQIETVRSDEIGVLLQALAQMQAALRQLVGDIRQSADTIQVASSEVASGNADLSQRTEVAAGSLQQTASSLEQLTGAVRQSAESAASANALASTAAQAARRGEEVVQQVVASMDDISASGHKIADIVGVIDGIAFQTNLLALNAAVEAARAGEQGRGFAVVAGEVRTLAQRAATAARQIKTLIGASVDRVTTGSNLVQQAGGTMQDILHAVGRVTDAVAAITAATAEQSEGIGEVNAAVSRLDQMTQQNAALVEQSAAAAESLRDQAQRLNGLVGTFKLDAASTAGEAA